jgi:hypothetical protein
LHWSAGAIRCGYRYVANASRTETIDPIGLASFPRASIVVLDVFEASFNVGCAEGQSEEGHGNRMQALRRLHDAGNGDQATAWPLRLERNPLAARVLRHMQVKRINRERCRHTTADRDQWPTAPKRQRISADVAAPCAWPIRLCRMGVARSFRSVRGHGPGISNDAALTTAPLQQASLAWPGTEEICPKCHGQRHAYYLHAGQRGVEIVGGKRVA